MFRACRCCEDRVFVPHSRARPFSRAQMTLKRTLAKQKGQWRKPGCCTWRAPSPRTNLGKCANSRAPALDVLHGLTHAAGEKPRWRVTCQPFALVGRSVRTSGMRGRWCRDPTCSSSESGPAQEKVAREQPGAAPAASGAGPFLPARGGRRAAVRKGMMKFTPEGRGRARRGQARAAACTAHNTRGARSCRGVRVLSAIMRNNTPQSTRSSATRCPCTRTLHSLYRTRCTPAPLVRAGSREYGAEKHPVWQLLPLPRPRA